LEHLLSTSGNFQWREQQKLDWIPSQSMQAVLPLCFYGKVLNFMIKTLDSQKNTRLQKQTYTQWKRPENALQCQHRHCATHCKPEAKKWEIATTLVCLYRSLQLLTH